MDINKYLEFPGILITIGVILLIISIIIILVAVKSDKKENFKRGKGDFTPQEIEEVEIEKEVIEKEEPKEEHAIEKVPPGEGNDEIIKKQTMRKKEEKEETKEEIKQEEPEEEEIELL